MRLVGWVFIGAIVGGIGAAGVTVSLSAPGAGSQPATQRAASRPATVEITGTVATKDTVVRVAAIDRGWADVLKTSAENPKDKFLYEGVFDAKTKTFSIPKLLPGRRYDLVIWTEDAAHEKTRWEGVCMDYHREILPATAADGSAEAATEEDKKWIADFVKEMPAFFDKARILHLAADHKHATALVELERTRDFHSQKGGEVIYRVELWYFENQFGGWAKDKNTEKVMARVRTATLPKNWQFLPGLGGIEVGKGVEVVLPEKAGEGNGLAGG